jgi:uncharacterized membrane protein YphA (DoxX/SURF4 family)
MKKAKNTVKKCDWTFLSSADMGLLVIRIFIGVIMVKAGLEKLMCPDAGLAFFAHLRLNQAFFWGTAFAETLGGIAIVLGYHTRGAAALITGVVTGILLLTWWMPGQEHLPYTISLMTNTLALFIMGGGAWSLDGRCKKSGNCSCETCEEKGSSCGSCGCETCEVSPVKEIKKEVKQEIPEIETSTE